MGDILHLKEEKDIRSAIVMAITAMLLLFEVLLLLARGHQVKLHKKTGKKDQMCGKRLADRIRQQNEKFLRICEESNDARGDKTKSRCGEAAGD